MSCPNSEPGEAGLGRECAGKAGKARLATPQASTSCPLSCSVFKEVLTPLPGLLPKSRVSRPHLKYSVWTVLTLSPVPQLHGFPQCSGSSPAGWALPPEPAHSGPCALTSQIKLLNASSAPNTPPQDISSTKLSSLTSPSFMYTSQHLWYH